jgi:peptidoglycan biosynthesis protein MviN/MurJ (putative lipid II flippase)
VTVRFRNVGEVKAWNDAMVVKYDLDRFHMVLFVLTGIMSVFIGFLADILIRGLYETHRTPAFYVRETNGRQGVE